MEVQHDRCAGLDVGKDIIVACARIKKGRSVKRQVESFGTTTKELLRLSEWLHRYRCTHVLMEATGVYWEPAWHLLSGSFEVVIANATHVKAVPGRKTDVSDAQWLADLLAHGLVRASFVPPAPIQQLRDLIRTRKQLVHERTRERGRVF
jgi:transposase